VPRRSWLKREKKGKKDVTDSHCGQTGKKKKEKCPYPHAEWPRGRRKEPSGPCFFEADARQEARKEKNESRGIDRLTGKRGGRRKERGRIRLSRCLLWERRPALPFFYYSKKQAEKKKKKSSGKVYLAVRGKKKKREGKKEGPTLRYLPARKKISCTECSGFRTGSGTRGIRKKKTPAGNLSQQKRKKRKRRRTPLPGPAR